MLRQCLLMFLFTFLVSKALLSAEVDHFTNRNESLDDAALIVNFLANKMVRTSLSELNSKKPGCHEKDLYKALREIFANHRNGQLTITILENPSIPKRTIEFKDSVFGLWSAWDGFIMGGPFFKKSGLSLSPLVRMGDQVVGTDKFEHMFGRGFQYFTNYYLKEKDIAAAVKRGVFDEKLIFGGNKIATGVFSYGDLSANFNGMRFWNHMLQQRQDVLGENIGPYIKCINSQFVQVKDIDFREYFDESMDEGINCSKFPTSKTLARYKARLKKLGFTCPVDPDLNQKMMHKYGRFAKWIINQQGNGVLDYGGEFEE